MYNNCVCFWLRCIQCTQCRLMRTLPKSAQSKRLDKYSPLLYMVKIEPHLRAALFAYHREKTQFPIKMSQAAY